MYCQARFLQVDNYSLMNAQFGKFDDLGFWFKLDHKIGIVDCDICVLAKHVTPGAVWLLFCCRTGTPQCFGWWSRQSTMDMVWHSKMVAKMSKMSHTNITKRWGLSCLRRWRPLSCRAVRGQSPNSETVDHQLSLDPRDMALMCSWTKFQWRCTPTYAADVQAGNAGSLCRIMP